MSFSPGKAFFSMRRTVSCERTISLFAPPRVSSRHPSATENEGKRVRGWQVRGDFPVFPELGVSAASDAPSKR